MTVFSVVKIPCQQLRSRNKRRSLLYLLFSLRPLFFLSLPTSIFPPIICLYPRPSSFLILCLSPLLFFSRLLISLLLPFLFVRTHLLPRQTHLLPFNIILLLLDSQTGLD